MSKSRIVTANLNTQAPNKHPPYPLGKFSFIYLLGVMALFVIIEVEPRALFVAYPGIGLVVSRFVNNRVIWWNQANSLENVFRAKLLFWLLWPLYLPIFIIKLTVARYL
ncbi:hypothetical protein [Pararhodobacter sp. SW119]|uniref:hypothetical protein n=1 Tax=Pararhodobacter sp. SW119 TaxID=2780075 RepID=UPI001ADF0356|nr:hypothetical protein [Pararhodobacter sp. SW119]